MTHTLSAPFQHACYSHTHAPCYMHVPHHVFTILSLAPHSSFPVTLALGHKGVLCHCPAVLLHSHTLSLRSPHPYTLYTHTCLTFPSPVSHTHPIPHICARVCLVPHTPVLHCHTLLHTYPLPSGDHNRGVPVTHQFDHFCG